MMSNTTTRTKATKTTTTEGRVDTIGHRLERRLDDLEANLPTIPAKWLELNRAVADRTMSVNRRNYQLLIDSVETVAKATNTSVRTVAGTVRWTTEKTFSVAATGLRTVVGQTKAQVKIAADTVTDEIEDLTDEAIDRVEATEAQAEKRHLRSMTKAELYEQAQTLDVEGRADMNKAQLINAITAA